MHPNIYFWVARWINFSCDYYEKVIYHEQLGKYVNEQQAIKKLEKEGFNHVYVHEDPPGKFYNEHTHGGLTAHIILEGEMCLTTDDGPKIYKKGDRVDVPANTRHSAQMGPTGCRYVIGE